MRRALSLAIAGFVLLLASAAQAQAQVVNFTVVLHGGNEVPPVATGSAGIATVSLNTATNVVTYRVEVYNMPTGTTASHFHVGAPGVAGPTVVDFTILPTISNDYAFSGSASALSNARPTQGINSWEDFIQALLLGNVYINVHSTANPGGEIRGPVVRVP